MYGKRIIKTIENHFGIFLISTLGFSLFFPQLSDLLNEWVLYFLMLILFFVFLKIDFKEVFSHLQNPILILYILLMHLIVIPVLVYFLVLPINLNLAIALLILTAMPSGASSPALVDLFRGSASLALVISVFTSLLAPFTLTFLCFWLLKTNLDLDLKGIFFTLLQLIFFPLIASFIVKYFAKDKVKTYSSFFGSFTIFLIALIVYAVVGSQADYIMANFVKLFWITAALFLTFFALQISGFFIGFWLSAPERIAISATKSLMNLSMGIIITFKYFEPEIASILILAELPWVMMLSANKYYIRVLFKTAPSLYK